LEFHSKDRKLLSNFGNESKIWSIWHLDLNKGSRKSKTLKAYSPVPWWCPFPFFFKFGAHPGICIGTSRDLYWHIQRLYWPIRGLYIMKYWPGMCHYRHWMCFYRPRDVLIQTSGCAPYFGKNCCKFSMTLCWHKLC
jgi:hypothetical protein